MDPNLGVVDVPCVVGETPIRITMHVVLGEVPCLWSMERLKENGATIDTQAELLKLTRSNVTRSKFEGESGQYEVDVVGEGKDFGEGRTVALRITLRINSPATLSRVLVTCWDQKVPRSEVSHQTGASLESAELLREEGTLYLQQPKGGPNNSFGKSP